ncbi:hypothetical protein WDH52_06010 [Streptomyces sp. TRM70308]
MTRFDSAVTRRRLNSDHHGALEGWGSEPAGILPFANSVLTGFGDGAV